MSDKTWRPSDRVVQRIRAFRNLHGLSQREAADGISRHGYPISRSILAAIETGRRGQISFDFVTAAAKFFAPSTYHPNEADIPAFLYGPLCSNCNDDPPRRYACLTCHRHRNDDGEVVSC